MEEMFQVCDILLRGTDYYMVYFQNVNPGLSRRFAIDDPFKFDDFTEDELMEVLDMKLRESDLEASDDAKTVARECLGRARNRPNFGNGGDVENLINKAKMRYQSRQASLPLHQRSADIILQPTDFDPEHDRQSHASANMAKLFEDLVGCDDIVQKLGKYQETAANYKRFGKDARTHIPTCFVFKGPPGLQSRSSSLTLSTLISFASIQEQGRLLSLERWVRSSMIWVFCPRRR